MGLGLVAAAVVWTLVSAATNDGSRPWPTVAALVAVTLAVTAGRTIAPRVTPSSAPVAVGVLAGVLAGSLLAFRGSASGGAPLGYGNANGALFAMVVLAAALLRVAVPMMTRPTRLATTAVGVAGLAACIATRSVGAMVSLAVGLVVALLAEALQRPWAAVPTAAIVLAIGLALTASYANGAGPEMPGNDSWGTRVQLWRAAADLAQDHRVTGVGPGRFDIAHAGISTDADLRRAHSTPLQTAAEQGGVGLALLLAIVGWALAALWSVGLHRVCAIGAGVLVTVGLQASWDWVLAEPAISLSAAVLVGWATNRTAVPLPRFTDHTRR